MHSALETLLNDAELNARMQANAKVIQSRDGLAVAANVIVDVARQHAGQ
jgi:UDP:flavonoid glycosyltransferase YjiC (YdhE family)